MERTRIRKGFKKGQPRVPGGKKPYCYREHRKLYVRKRRADPLFVLTERLRGRLRDALVRVKTIRAHKTMEMLGCTIREFRDHIASQFTPGMSFENLQLWHLDHIKPIAAFDLRDPEQQRQCFHYTNIQPLWAEDNVRKNARIIRHDSDSLSTIRMSDRRCRTTRAGGLLPAGCCCARKEHGR